MREILLNYLIFYVKCDVDFDQGYLEDFLILPILCVKSGVDFSTKI